MVFVRQQKDLGPENSSNTALEMVDKPIAEIVIGSHSGLPCRTTAERFRETSLRPSTQDADRYSPPLKRSFLIRLAIGRSTSTYLANYPISTVRVSRTKLIVSLHLRGDGSLYSRQLFVSDF